MQFGDFFFDGNKRKIYEAPLGFSYVLDGDGYRIYTPDDEPNAPLDLIYTTYDLWSRSVDFIEANSWSMLCFTLDGGAYRYTDQFSEKKYSLIDIRFVNDWAYVPCDYRHNTYIRGNCFPNKATNIDFDTDRITQLGVSPRIFFSDAGERSVADAEAQRIANASLVHSSFGGAAWLDPLNGRDNTGTETEPNGNQERPVNSAQLIMDVCLNRGFRTIKVLEDYDFVAGDDISKKHVSGVSHIATHIDLGYDTVCNETVFSEVHLTGVLDGDSEINNCVAMDIVFFNGHIHDSSIGGHYTLGGSLPAKFMNCSMADITKPLLLDCAGSGQDAIIDYMGLITVSNLTGPSIIAISMRGGIVTIDSTCTAGTIIVQRDFEIVDNSGIDCQVIRTEKTMVHDDIEEIVEAVMRYKR